MLNDEGIERYIIRLGLFARYGNRDKLLQLLEQDRGILLIVDKLAPLAKARDWATFDREVLGHEIDADQPEAVTLDSPISASGLEYRTVNMLEDAGYDTFRQLSAATTAQLEAIPNCGAVALESIQHWCCIALKNTKKAEKASKARPPRRSVVRMDDSRLETIIRANPGVADDALGEQIGISKARVWRVRQEMLRRQPGSRTKNAR